MNVGIFWVRVMKCMYAQTRPRFILSSEGVFRGMEFWTHVNSKGKIPSTENVPRGGSNPRRCGQRAQALPTELFRPPLTIIIRCVSRVLNQNGISQACYIIKIYLSGLEPLVCEMSFAWLFWTTLSISSQFHGQIFTVSLSLGDAFIKMYYLFSCRFCEKTTFGIHHFILQNGGWLKYCSLRSV